MTTEGKATLALLAEGRSAPRKSKQTKRPSLATAGSTGLASKSMAGKTSGKSQMQVLREVNDDDDGDSLVTSKVETPKPKVQVRWEGVLVSAASFFCQTNEGHQTQPPLRTHCSDKLSLVHADAGCSAPRVLLPPGRAAAGPQPGCV